MSGSIKVREDKTCLNCGSFVEKTYCPNCGQENSESRKSFHFLFTHFLFDLVHYEGAFWRTLKYLLFYPSKLTKEYMDGKRKSYVDPVKLYIFISFIAFLIPSLFSDSLKKESEISQTNLNKKKIELTDYEAAVESPDFVDGIPAEKKRIKIEKYNSVAQLDSIQNALPEGEKMTKSEYYARRVVLKINEGKEVQQEKLREMFMHHLPKLLFIYMPIFAFWLWLFHNKKERYFFDSGIFTLHYFSFLLLMITFYNSISKIFSLVHLNVVNDWILFISSLYILFYFFRANRLFYKEGRWVSNIKALLLIGINTICIIIVFLAFVWYTFVKVYNW